MSETSNQNTSDNLEITQERLVLSDRDRDLFISVMENPPELKGKLKDAIHKYIEQYGKS
ncbi:hypothetical protein DSM106972_022760 [Dulcicalothrix desertica PCC 7102]|uniref:DUF1778 domain-containing protein n=1 Tax=Dulcicalothrix desertica PCC 7102 TaxID=232991 RepID=A0A433VLV4_9CYAN|nr:hypothetical protein [Dulcicalothrix desertica]RUT07015.1 hypothetical protein DSM106972_022760 [Dulcicalothrix desertica PCC 7102]